ncbi:MAG TPA: hypothetical protein VG963_03530 [Polyangiaceae bacterium]|nr:hypothetical protein [Polyangiaceae bacterium]
MSLCVFGGSFGCGDIKQDKDVYQGGIAPDPSAIVKGTILYIGPRPSCVYDDKERRQRIAGNVILLLFVYENPPPPEGTATSAINLLVLSGDKLFQVSDCRAPDAPIDYANPITRSVEYEWSGLPLDIKNTVNYQVRGFFDYDEDFNPFFSVTRLPTAGDILGAAVNDVMNPAKGFFKIVLPSAESTPQGIVVPNVTVALGNPAWTERPAFKLDENHRLASDATFGLIPGVVQDANGNNVLGANAPAMLRNFRALTCKSGGTDGTMCGMTLEGFSADDAAAALRERVAIDVTNPVSYAFYTAPVDVQTVLRDAPDVPGADGKVDPHPFLGAGTGLDWYYPLVIIERQKSDIETQANVPRVLMMGSVLVDDTGVPTKLSYGAGAGQGVPVSVPPVAALELIQDRADCRIPYFAPGTDNLVGGNRLAHCGELPTGRFTVNVLAGLAGGSVQPATDPTKGDSPSTISGAISSGQAWNVPNELGDPLQTRAADLLPHQGVDGSFVVYDPMPGTTASCVVTDLHGICAGPLEIVEDTRMEGIDSFNCLPADCCAAVKHLCTVPRCGTTTTAEGDTIYASPTSIVSTTADGKQVPDCVPFEMPSACCQ